MALPIEDTVSNAKNAAVKLVKNRLYDVIAIIIIIAFIAISIGVIERRVITLDELFDFVIACVPLFFTGIILDTDLYAKGTFYGKQHKSYIASSAAFSKQVNSLTGGQIGVLGDFCIYYNEKALRDMQHSKLRTAGLNYKQFSSEWTKDGVEMKPLIVMTKKELKAILTPEQVRVVLKTKKLKVKGIKVNKLLGTNDSDDITDIGLSETQLKVRRGIVTAIIGTVSSIVLSLIAIKDIMEWGWQGIFLVLFKAAYILCKSLLSYFDGYNDVIIQLVNNMNRRTDILKESFHWIEENYPELKNDNGLTNDEDVGDNSENQ